jgi:protein-S-isoprenylcysteine O-methyltransferase Ste14
MADIAMVVGWILLSCSQWAVVVGASAIASLIMAPFAEESWLREQYGDEYEKYRSQVSRYFGVSASS